jgi:hypothetical protein
MIARVGKGEVEGSEHRLVTMAVSSILALIAIRFADANLTPAWTCTPRKMRNADGPSVVAQWRDGGGTWSAGSFSLYSLRTFFWRRSAISSATVGQHADIDEPWGPLVRLSSPCPTAAANAAIADSTKWLGAQVLTGILALGLVLILVVSASG